MGIIPWYTINNINLYKDFILLEDENRCPAIISFKDDSNNLYIALVLSDDFDREYVFIQEISGQNLIDFMNKKIELQSLLKSKDKIYKATPSYNPLEDGVVECLDSSIIDELPWKEDSYFIFNQTNEEKEYLAQLGKR